VHQRLEDRPLEGHRREPAKPQRGQLIPALRPAVEVVEHEPEQDQPEVAPEHRDRRGPRAQGGGAAEERQPVGEPDGEEELGHDRVGVAAIRVVVLQDRRDGPVAAQEIHQQHPGDRVAPELIERGEPAPLTRGASRAALG
jgi:hypothetical protein